MSAITSPSLFKTPVADPGEVRHALQALERDGIIPVSDRSGHRGAVQLWRDHCARPLPSAKQLRTEVDRLLTLPRFELDGAESAPKASTQLAWVPSADIMITTHPSFPYHFDADGLAELAGNLLTERGDPDWLAEILGANYGLTSVDAPHGRTYQVAHNGNHRTVAIRAAGFPLALALVDHHVGPWPLPTYGDYEIRAYLQLLFKAGYLTDYRYDDDQGEVANADRWGHLLIAENVDDALRNVKAYEQLYGRVESWPEWLRHKDQTVALVDRELCAAAPYGFVSESAIDSPRPATGWLSSLLRRILGGRTRHRPGE